MLLATVSAQEEQRSFISQASTASAIGGGLEGRPSLLGAKTVQDLRDIAADRLLQKQGSGYHFILDGHILPREPLDVFSEGLQHDVPLLLGSNADEGRMFLGGLTIRAASFALDLRRQFCPLPAQLLAHYPASSDQQARTSRANLERDLRFGWGM